MKLLLDTHVWIWSVGEQSRLAGIVAAELQNPLNEVWLSPISTWELFNLARKKRVSLNADPATWVREALSRFPYKEASMNHAVALESHKVDLPHRDPADRILAATAIVYQLTLVTADRNLLACESLSVLANQ